MNNETETSRNITFVTGMSGAGKSTTLNIFEDFGFEVVDNLPVPLLASLVFSQHDSRSVAIGIDVRTRDFDAQLLLNEINRIQKSSSVNVQILYLDCEDQELETRFKTTRRRHPLAHDRRVIDGIKQERRLLQPLREAANMVIDTTGRSVVDFRHMMEENFGAERTTSMTLYVTSFSFALGVPREADLVFDVRFLRNPHYEEELQALTGKDETVGDFIREDEAFDDFFNNLKRLISPLLPRYASEGKSYLTIALGCTGGRHRSVFTAECLHEWLNKEGHKARIIHRELQKNI